MPLSEDPICSNVRVTNECVVFAHRNGHISTNLFMDGLFVDINYRYPIGSVECSIYAAEEIEIRGTVFFHHDGSDSLRPLGGS